MSEADEPPKVSWREPRTGRMPCVHCHEERPREDLDRMLWCVACRERARRRATRWGWVGGALAAGGLALWIRVVVRPSADLVIGGWIATVVGAFWIGSRITREVGYGFQRWRGHEGS